MVKAKSFGLLSVTPRDNEGNEISEFEAHIIHDAQGRELKAWQAFAAYLEKQDRVDPGDFPAVKEITPSWNPVGLLFPMGAPTAIVVALILLVLLAAVLIVRRVVRRRKGRKAYRPYRGKK